MVGAFCSQLSVLTRLYGLGECGHKLRAERIYFYLSKIQNSGRGISQGIVKCKYAHSLRGCNYFLKWRICVVQNGCQFFDLDERWPIQSINPEN